MDTSIPPDPTTHRPRVLVVDGDPNALAALAELLGEAGYEVETASTDQQASDALATFRPSVVLTEVRTPGVPDGELEWTIVDGELAPQQVLMSAAHLPRDLSMPWIKKPIELDELLALLSRLTSGRR